MKKLTMNTGGKPQTCEHEWIADLSSLFAVVLLFSTVWFIMNYHHVTLEWMLGHSPLENILAYLILLLDAVLIVSLLCFGPNCHANNKNCMRTFKGRRKHYKATR